MGLGRVGFGAGLVARFLELVRRQLKAVGHNVHDAQQAIIRANRAGHGSEGADGEDNVVVQDISPGKLLVALMRVLRVP